jgi:glycosyltransferase involved in cell wall biosynthesis
MPKRHMLVFDTAYTYSMLIERKITAIITGKDHNGWFDHIWTVHPVASLLAPADAPDRFGKPVSYELAPGHTFIEGKFGRYKWLARFEKLNFALSVLSLLRLLFRLVRQHRVQIVRSEEIFFCGPMALLIGWWFRLPVMIGVWGNPGGLREQAGGPIMPRIFPTIAAEERAERFVLRRADVVMAQNEDNRRYAVGVGVAPEKTALFRLGNLINQRHFLDPAEREDGTADLAALGVAGRNVLLCISRLEEMKRPDHAVLALRTVVDGGGDAVLLMAGDGRFRNAMGTIAEQLGIGERVLFIGNRDQEWLWRVLPKIKAMLAPLAGRALAEAALAATPIVAYDVDWHGEMVESGVTGELVPHLDHRAMGEAALRLLQDPERAARLGRFIRERALDVLDPRKADRDQIAVYEALLNPEVTSAVGTAGRG